MKSRVGVNRNSFDKAVSAGLLEPQILPGETYSRYFTAQIIDVLVKG